MTQPTDPVLHPDARLKGAEQPPMPRLGQRYTHRPGCGERAVTVTGLRQAADGPLVAYKWRDDGSGTLRGCIPVDVFHRVYEPEQPVVDTLPEWLCHRFGGLDPAAPFPEIDRAYWEHQAAAVRRAVARGGFKAAS